MKSLSFSFYVETWVKRIPDGTTLMKVFDWFILGTTVLYFKACENGFELSLGYYTKRNLMHLMIIFGFNLNSYIPIL